MEIRGQRVLMTGGAVRVGRAIALDLAARGAKVVIQYHRSVDEAAELLHLLGGAAAGHAVICADLHDPALADQLFANGPFDILINNAAAFERVGFLDETESAAREQFEINFWVPYKLSKAFAVQQRGGCIVNIADTDALKSVGTGSGYGLSKKALIELTRLTARELAPDIRVNAVAPGPLMPPVDHPEARLEAVTRRMPLGRPPTLDELTRAVAFLIENDALTGHILPLDSGLHLI